MRGGAVSSVTGMIKEGNRNPSGAMAGSTHVAPETQLWLVAWEEFTEGLSSHSWVV